MSAPGIRGVVAFGADRRPELRDDLRLRPMATDEVRVQMLASGICHSDVGVMSGAMNHQALPVVLGHEGAGEVLEIGSDVNDIAVGDRVVITLTPPPCGRCPACARGDLSRCPNRGQDNGPVFRLQDAPAHAMFRIGSLAEQTLVPASRVVRVGDLDVTEACLLGCGVTTAFGAVFNTARLASGSSVLVLGCGGVGMGIIEAARAAGAGMIAAVDTDESKLLAARSFGATHTATPDGLGVLRSSTVGGRGFDVGFEVTGNPTAFDGVLASLTRDGLAVLVGIPRVGSGFVLTNEFLFSGRRVAASFIGDGDPTEDIPRYLELRAQGAVRFDGLVSSVIPLDGAVDGLVDLSAGTSSAIRTVVVLPG